MMSSPGLRGQSHLQAHRGVLQTTTDDNDRRQRPLLWMNKWKCEDFKCVWKPIESRLCLLVWPPYTMCRWASNNSFTVAFMFLSVALTLLVESGPHEIESDCPQQFCIWGAGTNCVNDSLLNINKKLKVEGHTVLSVPQCELLHELVDWHVVMSWIAVTTTETTQTPARQPAIILTANVSTPRQTWTFQRIIISERLIRRTTQHARKASSGSSAEAHKLTMLPRALRKETITLKNHVSNSQWSMHMVIQHNLGSQDLITSIIAGCLELNQVQVQLQQHVCTVLLARQQEVDAEWLHGSSHKWNCPDLRWVVTRTTTAAAEWKEVIHEEREDDWRRETHVRTPQQRQVDADKIVGFNVVAC